MKKLAKFIARQLGTIVGKIKYRKFLLKSGKLFSDGLFEEISERYNNVYLSRKYLEEQIEESKRKGKLGEKSNIELAVSRFLDNTFTSENYREYETLIKKMFDNSLVSKVFMFIQNNESLPLEYRFHLLSQFIDKEIVEKQRHNRNILINQTLVDFLSDVDINDDENKAKIQELNDLLMNLEDSNDEEVLADLKNWFKECGNMNYIYKCDALIEELKVLVDRVNTKKEEQERKENIAKIKEQIEEIKENIKNAKTIEDIEKLLNETNKLYASSMKQKISLFKECNELLGMIKVKKEEFVVTQSAAPVVAEEKPKVEVEQKDSKKSHNNADNSINSIVNLVKLALNYLSIEELEKAEEIYNNNSYMYSKRQRKIAKSLFIKSRAQIEISILNLEEFKNHPFVKNSASNIDRESKKRLTGDLTLSNNVYKGFCERIRVALKLKSITILNAEEELFNNVRNYLTNKQVEDLKRIFNETKYYIGQNNIEKYALLG